LLIRYPSQERHSHHTAYSIDSCDELTDSDMDEENFPLTMKMPATHNSMARSGDDSRPDDGEASPPLLRFPEPRYHSPDLLLDFPTPQPTEMNADEVVHVEAIGASPDTTGGSARVSDNAEENSGPRHDEPIFVLPLNAVLASASIGLLSFLGSATGNTAETVFGWLVAVSSVASLQTWASILFTYIRWHQGTTYAERKYGPDVSFDPHAQEVIGQIKKIRENRHWGQPYLGTHSVCA